MVFLGFVKEPADLTDKPGVAAAERRGWRRRASRFALDISPLRNDTGPFAASGSDRGSRSSAQRDRRGRPRVSGVPAHRVDPGGRLHTLTHLVPLLTLTVIGGAIADAFDRRRVMLVQQIGMIAGKFRPRGQCRTEQSARLAAVRLPVRNLHRSASGSHQRSMTPQLVRQVTLHGRIGTQQRDLSVRCRRRPGFRRLLAIKFLDLKWIYLGDTLSYVGAIVAVALLPRLVATENADRPSWDSIVAGFRYVRHQPVILGFFLVDTNAMIFGMPARSSPPSLCIASATRLFWATSTWRLPPARCSFRFYRDSCGMCAGRVSVSS